MINNLKSKMQNGERTLGTFLELGSELAIECLGYTGLDFFIIDQEHGPFDIGETVGFLRAAELSEITPLVRVKDISRPSILKNLDIGAKGLIVPNVESVEEAKLLVEWAKYSPIGKRGYFMARPSGYGNKDYAKDMNNYFETSNKETLLIPQCETMGALNNIEEILALEGIDGIFIGPFDLTIAMGIPAQFSAPEYKKALDRVLKACKENNKFCFIFSPDKKTAQEYINSGFDAVAIGMDASHYIQAFKDLVNSFK
ncbi:MAG: aldolase/citrate lyase family protein [Gudongella sp.]|nr:aldolase/citrate lyase family protein [Gudongella sp.]